MINYIFNDFKDSPINSVEKFKNIIYMKYGIKIDSSLYRRIINYQIKNYGKSLSYERREHVKNFKLKSFKRRKQNKELTYEKYKLERFEDRNNENKIKKI